MAQLTSKYLCGVLGGGAPVLCGGALVLGGGAPVLGVLGGGAPVGGVATEAVAADALVGGGNEGAAEAAAEVLDFSLIGRSFPVTGRMTSDV